MDPAIWSRLPEELLDYIICLLPPKHVFNLRSVSKHFKDLIFNPLFLSRCYSITSPPASLPSLSPFSSFLLLSHPQFRRHYPLYDSNKKDWRKFSVSLTSLFPNTNLLPSLLSTSNGLLCFSIPSSYSFFISNPLSKTSKLVKFPILPFSFEVLELISTYNGFKIFVISTGSSSSSSNSVVFLYDSKTDAWSELAGFEPNLFIDNYYQQGVHKNGWLYFTTTEPFSVVGFNLLTGKWGGSNLSNADLPDDLTFIRLVSGGCCGGGSEEGRLYMVGGIGRNGISRSLKLWELIEEDEGNYWAEVGTLPDLMYKKFVSVCYHNYEHVYCFWHEGLVCICCYTWPEVLFYRVGRRTWHWVPKCPSLYEKWSCGFRWFSFVPHITSAV